MRAAVHRTTQAAPSWGRRVCLGPNGFDDVSGAPRPAGPGEERGNRPAGDLCVLSVPPAAALAELDAAMVAATIIGGDVVYSAKVAVSPQG